MEDDEPGAPITAVERWLPWAVGLATGLVVMGPALGPGSLFNLDLVVMPDLNVPRGMWGLGPELPRRVPYVAPLAWLSMIISGTVVLKIFMVACVALAVAGMARLTRPFGLWIALGAGLLFGAGPWFLTRVYVGHFGIYLAAALLPWALPTLLRPGRSLARTALWCLALGFTGITGGQMAGLLVAVGLIADRERRWLKVVAIYVTAQLPWLVPGVIVFSQGIRPADSALFATEGDTLGGVARVLIGYGFWEDGFQLGRDAEVVAAVIVIAAVPLAVFGHRSLPRFRGRLLAVAVAGLAVTMASLLPGVEGIYEALADTTVGAPIREGQRFLVLWLLWLLPATAAGVGEMCRRFDTWWSDVVRVSPLALAGLLLAPSVVGFGGTLEPHRLSPGWTEARATIAASPGTTLALPFRQYLPLDAGGGRLVHHPVPLTFPGDVLASSGTLEGTATQERSESRAEEAQAILDRSADGSGVAEALAELGVRWVVVVASASVDAYDPATDDGLRLAVEDDEIALWEVRAWSGTAHTDDGSSVDVRTVIPPLARAPAGEAAVWNQPAAAGWMRGSSGASSTTDGRVRLPAGSGAVWYWPTALVMVANVAALVLLGLAIVAWRRPGR